MSVSTLPRTTAAHWLTEERIRIYSGIVFGIFVVAYLALTAMSLPDCIDPRGEPVGYDFITFWSGARLALHGRPEATFDWQAIAAAQHAAVPTIEKLFLWHYPPTFLLAVLPLGLMPYIAAFAAFSAGSVGLWAALVRRIVPDPRYWIVAAAMPAGLINFFHGQNGFLTAALAGFALLLLDAQPIAAGALIGLLAIKPHLAILFPVALAASRNWRAFAAAAVTAILFTAASIAAFGWPTVTAFIHDIPSAGMLIDEGILPWGMMPSPYVFALGLHLPKLLATALQAIIAIAAIYAVWRVWREPRAPDAARAATLLTAALLMSPYVFYYDMTWAGLAVGVLALSAGEAGFLKGEREVLLAAWVAPILMVPIYKLTGLQAGAVVLVLLLAVAVRRASATPSFLSR
ncbi:MAG TPA: glycosyltransferase family 87 protein [Stellaceae bacterium]|nr:glycosyltransferase family 87 protein [Stellaceae bacterium]